MTFKEYQERSYKAIQPHADKKDTILNWTVGLAEEAGEVLGLIKHKYWGKEEPDKLEIAKEMGDVIWYLSALANELGLNIDTIAQLNCAKLEHRFGTGEFSDEQSKNRHEAEKAFADTEVCKNILNNLTR